MQMVINKLFENKIGYGTNSMFGGFRCDEEMWNEIYSFVGGMWAEDSQYFFDFYTDDKNPTKLKKIALEMHGTPDQRLIVLDKENPLYITARRAYEEKVGVNKFPKCEFAEPVDFGYCCQVQVANNNIRFSRLCNQLLQPQKYTPSKAVFEYDYTTDKLYLKPDANKEGILVKKNTQVRQIFDVFIAQYGL